MINSLQGTQVSTPMRRVQANSRTHHARPASLQQDIFVSKKKDVAFTGVEKVMTKLTDRAADFVEKRPLLTFGSMIGLSSTASPLFLKLFL